MDPGWWAVPGCSSSTPLVPWLVPRGTSHGRAGREVQCSWGSQAGRECGLSMASSLQDLCDEVIGLPAAALKSHSSGGVEKGHWGQPGANSYWPH